MPTAAKFSPLDVLHYIYTWALNTLLINTWLVELMHVIQITHWKDVIISLPPRKCRTVGCCEVFLHRYLDDNWDLNCECSTGLQTVHHLLKCPLLEQICPAEDLTAYNDAVHKSIQHWLYSIWCFVDLIRRQLLHKTKLRWRSALQI